MDFIYNFFGPRWRKSIGSISETALNCYLILHRKTGRKMTIIFFERKYMRRDETGTFGSVCEAIFWLRIVNTKEFGGTIEMHWHHILCWRETVSTTTEALLCLGGILKDSLIKLPWWCREQCHCWYCNDSHVKPKTKQIPPNRQPSMIPIQTRNTTETQKTTVAAIQSKLPCVCTHTRKEKKTLCISRAV